MPAPSLTWNLARVFGTWRNLDGTLKAGTFTVKIPARVTDSTDDTIIPAGTFLSGQLQTQNDAAPSLDVLVPCTDDPDIQQTGWTVQIVVTFDDASATENYSIDVPYANRPVGDGGNGLGVDLRTVALAVSLPQEDPLYKVGVPGGLAELNANGDVVDANGNVVGSGGGAGTVTSVNGVAPDGTGDVVLTAADVGADAAGAAGSAQTAAESYTDSQISGMVAQDALVGLVQSLFPGLVQEVEFDDVSQTWPDLADYTDPNRTWKFVGGDDTHQPPIVAGAATWDKQVAA